MAAMVPLLDTHQHLVYPDRQRYAWMAGAPALSGRRFGIEDYKALTPGAGIAGTLFMEVDADDWRDEAEMVAALAAGEGSGILGTIAACRPEVEAGFEAWLDEGAELGVVGLVVLLAFLLLPLAHANLRTGPAPVAAGAYVVFLVHTGLDWDWELPALTLTALLVAAKLLAEEQ